MNRSKVPYESVQAHSEKFHNVFCVSKERIVYKRLMMVIASLAMVLLAVPPVQAQTTKEVSLLTTFGGSELDAMRTSLDAFTAKTGIDVTVESNRNSMPLLRTRLAGGNPPDLALIPQPGTLAEFANQGKLIALVNKDGSAGMMDPKVLTDNYASGILALGTVNGTIYGFLAKANSKSTVWYKPASFKALGVDVPKTWDDLIAIQQKYVAAGKTPWSIGGSDSWTLTDWFENIYVRQNGADMYQKLFATHDIPWTDPTVVKAFQTWQQVVSPADKNLAGGIDGTLSTKFDDAARLVFRPDSKAEMYYEGGFIGGIIASSFPTLKVGTDFDAFLFPQMDAKIGTPITIGGDLIAAFNNRPEVAQLLTWLAGAEGNTLWAKTGAIVSPNKNVDLSVYTPLGAIDANQVHNAQVAVFDGSDQMPPAMSTQFGIDLQNFVSDPTKLTSILQDLEKTAVANYKK